jgi:hypothetical protein
VGAHLTEIHGNGQRERPSELSVLPLDATVVLIWRSIFLTGQMINVNERDAARTSPASLRTGLLLGPYVLAALSLEAI